MPCRSEQSVATIDQQGKRANPLTTAPDNNEGKDTPDDDSANPKAKGRDSSSSTDKNKKERQKKGTGKAGGEDNKENNEGDDPMAPKEGEGQSEASVKSSGLCSGNKSVQVKDGTRPVGKNEQGKGKSTPNSESAGAKDDNERDDNNGVNKNKQGTQKTTETTKKSTGMCRSDKDVQVIDTAHDAQVKPDETDPKVRGGRKTPVSGSAASLRDKTGEAEKPPASTESGGFCRRQADVAVRDSVSKEPGQQQQQDAKGDSGDTETKGVGSPTQPANQKPPTGRSGTCCGGKSVEVKESLRPLVKPEEKAESDPNRPKDDSFGEPIYSGLEDLSHSKEDEEESFEEIDDDNEEEEEDEEDESDASEEIIVKPEPPPPKIKNKKKEKKEKKKKKKRKASNDYVEDTPSKGGPLAMNPRKGKYSVTTVAPDHEEEPLYAQVESSPIKKKQAQTTRLGAAMETDMKDTPTKRKKKKKLETETQDDIRSAYENQIASLAATSGSEGGFTINDHPTVEEESELLENAEAERRKNKQRLREKKLKEASGESPIKKGDTTSLAYENAQREIDRVLAPRIVTENQEEESDGSDKKKKKKHKDKSKKKKNDKSKGEDNEAYSSDEKAEETLEEAKARMHQLLDDAFSLFSHSRSSLSNKVAPSKQSSEEKSSPKVKKKDSPRSNKSSPRESTNQIAPKEEEKKHTPMTIIRSNEPYDRSGLVTWDPYKAADETAIISLPSTQTNLSSQPPQQERLTTSTFTETLPGSLRPNYYATQPAEPIIIRSRELEESSPNPDGAGGRDFYMSSGNFDDSPSTLTNGNPSQQRPGTHHGTFQNPLYNDSYSHAPRTSQSQSSGVRIGSRHAPPYHQQPTRHADRQFEPYYGLSSYQEIPQASTIPGQADHTDTNPTGHREASFLNGIGTLDYSNPTYRNGSGRNSGGSSQPYHTSDTRNYSHHEMQARPGSRDFSRSQNGVGGSRRETEGEIRSHTTPQRGENPNLDEVDAVSRSLRPGASPQPLINSLREELQMLASRRGVKEGSAVAGATAPSRGTTRGSTKDGAQSLR